MKLNLNKYLLYSSVFAIFSEGFFFNFIIDWKLFYLIIFINYFLIIIYYKKISFNNNFVLIVSSLLIHAIICYSVILIPPNYFMSQLLGISVAGLYFYNFFKIIELEDIKKTYLDISFITIILGFVFYFIRYNPLAHMVNDFRLMSYLKEPAHYVVLIIPACYYYFINKQYFKFILALVSIILSTSSLGIIGLGLIFILPFFKLKKIKQFVAVIPFIVLAFILTYNYFLPFKMRMDDSIRNLNVINNGKFDDYPNLTSYVILSNMYIAKQNITDHPFGSGIGSHHHMYTKEYYKYMRPPEYIKTIGHAFDNSFDANSLFVRLVSELGIFGFIFVFFIIYYIQKSFSLKELHLAQGVAIYLILKLIRDGHYFSPELYFFIWLMYFEIKSKKSLLS